MRRDLQNGNREVYKSLYERIIHKGVIKMKNFINNTLAIIVAVVVAVIIFAIGVAVGAFIMSHGGDIFTSMAAGIVTPIGIMDWLTNI